MIKYVQIDIELFNYLCVYFGAWDTFLKNEIPQQEKTKEIEIEIHSRLVEKLQRIQNRMDFKAHKGYIDIDKETFINNLKSN